MSRAATLVCLSFCLGLGTVVPVAAQPGDDHPGHPMGNPHRRAEWVSDKLTKELNLNADQAAKVKQLFEEEEPMPMPRPGEMGGEFMKQLRASSPDTAAMNRDFETHMAKMRAKHAERVKRFAELHAIPNAAAVVHRKHHVPF